MGVPSGKLFLLLSPFFFSRWSELTRKLQLEVEVQELGENGDYSPVEVQPRSDVGTGGVFQLRQGQQRRILVAVRAQDDDKHGRGISG